MTRYGIFVYFVLLVGMVLGAIYGIGHYIQAAYAYQIANNIPSKVEEGSFWLTMNPDPFLIPGVSLIIVGLLMAVHEGVTSVNNKQQAEAAKQ